MVGVNGMSFAVVLMEIAAGGGGGGVGGDEGRKASPKPSLHTLLCSVNWWEKCQPNDSFHWLQNLKAI